MKKILSILTLSVLMASLVLPFALPAKVMAVGPGSDKIQDYCRINTHFKISIIDKGTFNSDDDMKVGDYVCPADVSVINITQGIVQTPHACEHQTDSWAMVCLFNTIYTATKWIFWILISVSTIMIIIGAFLYMTSQGNENQMKSGKSTIIYAIIGLILAALAKFLPALARFIVGM